MQELELTKGRVLKIWWSLWWRHLIVCIVGFIAGFFVGFVVSLLLSFVLMPLGFGIKAVSIISNGIAIPLCFVLGIYFSCLAVKLALKKKDFGGFRIALVPVNDKVAQ